MLERATSVLSVLIVDDEQLASDELVYLLKEFPDVGIAGDRPGMVAGVKAIEQLEPDVVFLDVQMPGLDGLGVIRQLREKNVPLPYFVMATAFEQYAVEAFRVEAFDYLLKPVDKDRLAETIDRARRTLQEKNKTQAPLPVAENSAPHRTKLLVKAANRNLIVDANDVIYATIDDGLITVVTTAFEGQSNYRTIEELQSNLDPDTFWECTAPT